MNAVATVPVRNASAPTPAAMHIARATLGPAAEKWAETIPAAKHAATSSIGCRLKLAGVAFAVIRREGEDAALQIVSRLLRGSALDARAGGTGRSLPGIARS